MTNPKDWYKINKFLYVLSHDNLAMLNGVNNEYLKDGKNCLIYIGWKIVISSMWKLIIYIKKRFEIRKKIIYFYND